MKTCWECSVRPENKTVLLPEGGVTTISLHNAHVLIHEYGLPERVELFQDPKDGHLVEMWWSDIHADRLTGFSWGYGGEGPRGLEQFFKMLNFSPPIGIHQIGLWPQNGFPALTFVKWEDYGPQVFQPVEVEA